MRKSVYQASLLLAVLSSTAAHAEGLPFPLPCNGPECPPEQPLPPLPPGDNSRVIEVPSDGIERYMNFVPLNPGIPPSIQGLWWMDGNPLGDIVTTLSNSTWDPATRTAVATIYGEGNYSFRDAKGARGAYAGTVQRKSAYEVQFNEDYTFAVLTPTHLENGQVIRTPPSETYYTMRLVTNGLWIRESYVDGLRLPDYRFRRIVRPDGQRDPAYAEYLKFADRFSYLIGHF